MAGFSLNFAQQFTNLKNIFMKKTNISQMIALTMLLISCVIPSHAAQETVEVDGIYYTLISITATPAPKPGGYSGDIVVPGEIYVNGKTYKVSFGGDAFSNCPELKSFTANHSITGSRPRYIFELSFQGCSSLEKVVMPECTSSISSYSIPESAFEGCEKLSQIENFPNPTSSFSAGNRVFWGCKSLNPLEFLKNFSIIDYSKPTGVFAYCNISSVSNPDLITIPDYTFYNCPITYLSINQETTTSIGSYAFYTPTYPVSNFTPYEGLETLGDAAFYGSFETLTIPSTLKELGNGGMLHPDILKSVTIADGNTYFSIKDNVLYNTDDTGSKTLIAIIAGNDYTGESVFKDTENVTEIASSAFYNMPITGYDFPALKQVGNNAFSGTSLEQVTLKQGITYGEYAFSDCKSLKDVTIENGVTYLPNGIFKGCNFTAIKLSSMIKEVEASALPNSVISVDCLSPIPPKVNNYTADNNCINMSNVTLTCPQGSVEAYKNHEVWGKCKEIIGNPEWDGLSEITAIPDGLWYAQKGGNICYVRNGNVIDTEILAGAHPFQMQIYNGALYVADAGKRHYYSTKGTEYGSGDGQLYKLEKFGETYAKTGMLTSETTGCDFGDPYTCFIDQSTGDIYASDRYMGVYRFNANEQNWYNTQYNTYDFYNDNSKYFVRHQWLDYYGAGIAYGAIIRGFQRDSKGVNWLLCDFNGQGIYRFKDSDIHSDGNIDTANRPYGIVASGVQTSAMYLDEANGYLYLFSRATSNHGLYRIPLSTIDDNTNTDRELIDASMAAPENATSDEGVYVRQITGDGKNIYWSFISADDPAESGIKMIPATGTPTVSYVLKGVEAYGLAVSNFDTSGIEAINADNDQPRFVNIIGNKAVAIDDVTVVVYNISGITETTIKLVAGESITLDNLTAGVHIIKATNANGATQTAKIIL